MSYVIRVNPSRFGKATWIMDNPMLPGTFNETTGKQYGKRYPTRTVATEAALMRALENPDYMGKLSVQWVPTCGS
jgi:hypothetical protein